MVWMISTLVLLLSMQLIGAMPKLERSERWFAKHPLLWKHHTTVHPSTDETNKALQPAETNKAPQPAESSKAPQPETNNAPQPAETSKKRVEIIMGLLSLGFGVALIGLIILLAIWQCRNKKKNDYKPMK